RVGIGHDRPEGDPVGRQRTGGEGGPAILLEGDVTDPEAMEADVLDEPGELDDVAHRHTRRDLRLEDHGGTLGGVGDRPPAMYPCADEHPRPGRPSQPRDIAAAILRQFISDDNYWLLARHPLFQTYFCARHLGLDANARDKYKGHPASQKTVDVCARWDEV